MAFDGLKDNLKEQWAELTAKIQESSAFNTAREKFESQTPTVQKAMISGSITLSVFFLLYFLPISYLLTSFDNMAEFEENRGLIQGLLRASRIAKEASPLPPPMDSGMLRSTVERVLREKKLVPEQIGDMQALPGVPFKGLPAEIVQNGIAAQIKKLTLTQMIEIGNSFHNLGPGTKLIGVDVVQSPGQTHYYDMIVRVANFGLPTVVESEPEPPPKKGQAKSKSSTMESDE